MAIRNKKGQFTSKNTKKNNPRWRGGKTIDRNGYIKILKPASPMADSKGYVYLHRLRMAKHLGRKSLKSSEIVHHINGNRKDNRIKNLELLTDKEHRSKHGVNSWIIGRTDFTKKCTICGKKFKGGSGAKYCSNCKTKKCPTCGEKFKTDGKQIDQKYCCRECMWNRNKA